MKLNRRMPIAAAVGSLLLAIGSAHATVLLSTGFDGTSNNGATLSGITYTTENGLSGPTSLSGNPLHTTADAVGHYAPNIQVNNSTWNVDIPLTVTVPEVTVNSVLLDRQHFNVAGSYNTASNKTYPIIVTLTGSSSGQIGQVTLDPNPWPSPAATETFNFGAASLTNSESWTLNVQVNDGGATNAGIYVGFDGFAIEGLVGAPPPPPPAALVAHWRLDEIAGQIALDSTGNGFDGQLGTTPGADANDPAVGLPGTFGTAFGFVADPGSRVDLSAHIGSFAPLLQGSLVGWFMTDSTARGALLNFGEANTTDRMLVEMLDSGALRFLVREGDSNTTDLTTSASFNDGAWHHFAVTNDGSDTQLLIDGAPVLLSSSTDGGDWFGAVTGVNSFTLGYETRTNGQFPFEGVLDDFAVFDGPLTSEQLRNVIAFGADRFDSAVIPEPASATLALLGVAALMRRRRAA